MVLVRLFRQLVLGVLAAAMVAAALSTAAAQQPRLELAVGDWPPYLDQDDARGGALGKVLTEIFDRMGYDLSLRFLPWARGYEETARGEHQAMGVWMFAPDRAKDFLYSEPVLTETFVLFYEKSTSFDWNKVQDLEPFVLGGGLKYSYGADIDAALANGLIQMERVNDVVTNFRKLLHGRIDLYPQEINVGYAELQKYFSLEEQNRIRHHPKAYLNNDSFVLFPKSLPDSEMLVRQFNEALRQYRQSGAYEKALKTVPLNPL